MPDSRRHPGPIAILAISLATGLTWMALELGLTLAAGRVLVPAQLVERMLWLLPWQLAVFAGIGVAVAILARLRPLSFGAVVWWAIGLGAFAFFGEALLEGLLRKKTLAHVLLALGLLAASLALLAVATLALRNRLSGRLGRAFLPGVWAGFSLFFLTWMQHTIASTRIWEPGLRGLWAPLGVEQVGIALAGAGVVGVLAALAPGARAGAAAAAGALLLLPSGPPAEADGAPGAPRPDILVLLIDTLRFDHIGANVGREGLTPALDALAAESVRFELGFSPGNFTKLAVPGIKTSLPYRVTHTPLPEDVTTLAEHLKGAGYATYGISANPYITGGFGYAQGYDLFLDPGSVNEFLVEGLLEAAGFVLPGPAYRAGVVSSALYYAPADVIRRRALEFFADSPGPTFVYLQTMDPHGPYLPPHRYLPDGFEYGDFESYYAFDGKKGQGVLGNPEYQPRLRNIVQRYEGEVRFTDEEVGKLVAGLREAGRWDEMLVIVLSDHGEAFGEKDWAGHSGHNISRTLVQVPFMLKPPRSWGIAPGVESSAVSTYDVLPTLLSMLDLPPAETYFGRDLGPLLRNEADLGDRVVVSFAHGNEGADMYAAVRWPWKLDVVLDRKTGERRERTLYDLRSDPDELVDVSALHPEVVRELSVAVQAWRDREDRVALADEGAELDPMVREQLRKLGYVE